MQQEGDMRFSVIWRGQKFVLDMNSGATLKDLGSELQKQTNVRADTMRLIVSKQKSAQVLYPFSDEHSCLCLEAVSIIEGKSIRMMGVPQNEVDEVLQQSKVDLRIAGFDEENKRIRQRMSTGQYLSQLPRGNYIFCDFRTLQIPGIELNPPPSEALKLMHRLAADPGIVAIMNKHRWRVGIMTEMAPVGYVGVSPMCILGLNKNHGEEISLRLRTDDLRGFRKYESIKNTLLHELAHMVHSEHDANFYALNKQLNEEAVALDWTKSRGHTMDGKISSQGDEEEFIVDNGASLSRKLGGEASGYSDPRASSVSAAYLRLAASIGLPEPHAEESDPKDSGFDVHKKFDYISPHGNKEINIENTDNSENLSHLLKSDDQYQVEYENKPNPDNYHSCERMKPEHHTESSESGVPFEPNPDDYEMTIPYLETGIGKEDVDREDYAETGGSGIALEPDPEESEADIGKGPEPNRAMQEPNQKHSHITESMEVCSQVEVTSRESDPDDGPVVINRSEADADYVMQTEEPTIQYTGETAFDEMELQRIRDSVSIVCMRLQKAVDMLRSEVNPSEASRVLQTLLKIVQNVIEHPDEGKFKRLRKANPVIQRNILKYRAAMEIMSLIGFTEEKIFDNTGMAEIYLILKQNDPGRLWLAKSSIETYV